ncbi:hypothetical protein [Ancylobacter oerskovii]|nr:hypothetical protein [Ancylobacter oerskovii]MBS7542038.1 hypothetical protein [Ancylobacter oerskovii]
MRSHEPAEEIAARAAALRPFLGQGAERRARLARLLRAERRAALTGIGYDAARHAALRRLENERRADERRADERRADVKKAAAAPATACSIKT